MSKDRGLCRNLTGFGEECSRVTALNVLRIPPVRRRPGDAIPEAMAHQGSTYAADGNL
jgi:hypothetical protein